MSAEQTGEGLAVNAMGASPSSVAPPHLLPAGRRKLIGIIPAIASIDIFNIHFAAVNALREGCFHIGVECAIENVRGAR